MNNKIITIGLLLTALNANAQSVNNCDSTCYQNTTQSQTPINTNTTSTGGAVLSNNFNSIQNPVGAQTNPSATKGSFVIGNGSFERVNPYTGRLSCPNGYAAVQTSNAYSVNGFYRNEFICVQYDNYQWNRFVMPMGAPM